MGGTNPKRGERSGGAEPNHGAPSPRAAAATPPRSKGSCLPRPAPLVTTKWRHDSHAKSREGIPRMQSTPNVLLSALTVSGPIQARLFPCPPIARTCALFPQRGAYYPTHWPTLLRQQQTSNNQPMTNGIAHVIHSCVYAESGSEGMVVS